MSLQRAVRPEDVHLRRRLLRWTELEFRNLYNAFVGQRHGKNQEGELSGPDPTPRTGLLPTLRPRQVELGSALLTTVVPSEIGLPAMPAQNVKMPRAMTAYLGRFWIRMLTLWTNQLERKSRAGQRSF